ncbi:hypothetical protein DPMN_057622 [Dreissena polymorpha]|uniref:Uncharacterized protein n=1 Tax=Dreissena polymorpha TaxID=45954 RepID=A0A9D4HCB5_DREPO|nr:hypothetical protein DPMN_057622 [Dreissena polymorpha]
MPAKMKRSLKAFHFLHDRNEHHTLTMQTSRNEKKLARSPPAENDAKSNVKTSLVLSDEHGVDIADWLKMNPMLYTNSKNIYETRQRRQTSGIKYKSVWTVRQEERFCNNMGILFMQIFVFLASDITRGKGRST